MHQIFTRYFIPPTGSKVLLGTIFPVVDGVVGLASLIYQKTPMVKSFGFGRFSWGEKFEIILIEGNAGFLLAFFYLFLGASFFVTEHWSTHPQRKHLAPTIANVCVLAWLACAIASALM